MSEYLHTLPSGPSILLAEDDPNDVFLLQLALEKARISNPLIITQDGQQAVSYLNGDGPFADRDKYPLPALLLLDLKMPGMDGFDVLAFLNRCQDLRGLPVVVLSSSDHPSDLEKARRLGVTDYRVKPQDFAALVELAQELHARWLAGTSASA
jgi:CheY-like chemotaxis protein